MSTALVSAFYDVNDVVYENNRNLNTNTFNDLRHRADRCAVDLPQRHSTNSTTTKQSSSNLTTLSNLTNKPPECSLSLTDEDYRLSRYKTELCRPFEESGKCKYRYKCQFAHGVKELRQLSHHPKHKTKLCFTFHTNGFCYYGLRCNYIHNIEEHAPPPISHRSPPPPSPLNRPSPLLTEPALPLPTSLTPPSPSPLSFYNDKSPLPGLIESPLPLQILNSYFVNNVFKFPSPTQDDLTPVISPLSMSSPHFTPSISLKPVEEERDDLPPMPLDALHVFDTFSPHRLPVFNTLGYN